MSLTEFLVKARIDARVRVSLVGVDLLKVEARVVLTCFETYLNTQARARSVGSWQRPDQWSGCQRLASALDAERSEKLAEVLGVGV